MGLVRSSSRGVRKKTQIAKIEETHHLVFDTFELQYIYNNTNFVVVAVHR